MKATSELIYIKNIGEPSVDYIETELKKLSINPLRWSIVHVDDKMFTVSVSNLKE